MIRKCRDCGRKSSEHPDDPAPSLCPKCYEARLARITPQFEQAVERLGDPRLVAMWLADALIEIGGETPDFAWKHAMSLLREVMSQR